MRVQLPGVRRCETAHEFRFEGRPVTAYPGETVASALVAAGILAFRETRGGKPRGPFCGMGVCGDCQVLVDGESKRACMEPARANLEVARHPALFAPAAAQLEQNDGAWQQCTPDLLVIGAGPAGLSAARVAAKAGLEVLIVDERNYPGGQYYKQPGSGFRIDESAIDRQFAAGRQLIRDTEAAGARFCSGAVVWCVLGPCSVAALTPEGNLLITAKRIILATGAYERALPVPGWTLPGVMTTGAAQTFLRAYQTAPGRRVLIAGNGPLNLQVADELSRAGVDVAGVVELAASPWRLSHAALAMALLSPRLAWAGVRHVLNLARRGVAVHHRHVLTSIEGKDVVAAARIAALKDDGSLIAGSERMLEVDAVCVNHGFLPQSELARALGCAFDYDHTTGRMQARRDDEGRSSVAEIFIAGDAGGLGGAEIAADQGKLAALSVASDLLRLPLASSADAQRLCGRLRRNTRFQKALWEVFSAPHLTTQLSTPQTIICRCEEIDRQSLDALMSRDHPSLAITKKQTRAGMGACQGRYCTTLMATLSACTGGRAPSVQEYFAPRPPFKPIAIGRLAHPFGTALQPSDINLTTTDGTDG